jgi:transposase
VGKVDTAVIVECVEPLSQPLDKRTYVFLDNAPVHKSHEFSGHIAQWVQRGWIIKYLPAYAPELNLIEILWRFMKDHWLPFSAYTSLQLNLLYAPSLRHVTSCCINRFPSLSPISMPL